ncbi:MAG: VOC family protein [Kiritimatiellae bacterium]|nr:VOC family protein [Kiritimatiellia bacterium]
MQFEHFALNVPDAKGMADWYIGNCGMRAVRAMDEAPYTHFLADRGGRVVMEIYTNPKAPIPDYAGQPPQCFHFALAVDDPGALQRRLVEAGATLVEELKLDDGSHLVMLRDPWGVPLQLCNRAEPLV